MWSGLGEYSRARRLAFDAVWGAAKQFLCAEDHAAVFGAREGGLARCCASLCSAALSFASSRSPLGAAGVPLGATAANCD